MIEKTEMPPQEPSPLDMMDDPAVGAVAPDAPPQTINRVPEYMATEEGRAFLEELGRNLCTKIKRDAGTRDKFMERRANQIKLFAGDVGTMEYPADGGKRPNIPILTKVILRLVTRFYDQIVPRNGDITHAKPTGPEDVERARRVEKHSNWQKRNRMKGWAHGIFITLLQWALGGSAFRQQRVDHRLGCPMPEPIPIEDMIISYGEPSYDPEMADVERITRVHHFNRRKLQQLEDDGVYYDVGRLFNPDKGGSEKPVATEGEDRPVRKAADEAIGVAPPDIKDETWPRDVYECHTWTKFPGEERERPTVVAIDKDKQIVLSLFVREEDDPIDRQRYDAELKAAETKHAAQMQQYQTMLAQREHIIGNAMAMGAPPPMLPPEPPPPPPLEQPKPVKKIPEHHFVHFGCIPNPEGFYNFGIGYLLEGPNEVANQLAAEYVMGLRFSNIASGFVSDEVWPEKGELQWKQGYFKKVKASPEALDKGMKVVQFPAPNASTMEMVRQLDKDAESTASAPDLMSGQPGPTNETKTAVQIRDNHARTFVSVLVGRFLDALTIEEKHNARINSLFLDEKEYFYVLDPEKDIPDVHWVGRDDYLEGFDISFTAESRMASQQERIEKAQMLLGSVAGMPPELKNPEMLVKALQEFYLALDRPDVAAMVKVPQPEPPKPMPQHEENALFIREKYHPALPNDDHPQHLLDLELLRQSPMFGKLSKTAKQMIDMHEREHLSFFYLMNPQGMNAVLAAQANPPGGPNGMAPGRPNPGAPPRPGGPPPGAPPGGRPPGGEPVGLGGPAPSERGPG